MLAKSPLLVLLIALACANFGGHSQESLGELRLTTPRLDFGEVREGDLVHSTIEVHNSSVHRATLTGASVGCSCFRLARTAFPVVVAPGATFELVTAFDARGQHGRQERQIMLLHDLLHQDALVVAATGFVHCPMWALQDVVVWATESGAGEHRGYVDVELGDVEPWRVLSVYDGAGRSMAWEVEDRSEAERRLRRILLRRARLEDGERVNETLSE